jgi:hypothetical protein
MPSSAAWAAEASAREAANASALAVSNDEGARTGEVAKSVEDALGAALLDDRNRNRHGREHEQDDGFLQVAQQQVDYAAPEQQSQHRLAQHFEDDAQCCSLIGPG